MLQVIRDLPHSPSLFLILTFHVAMWCRYLPGPDDMLVLDIAYMIYLKYEEYSNALQIALFLDNMQVRHYEFRKLLLLVPFILNQNFKEARALFLVEC